jgi:hypothetical protein
MATRQRSKEVAGGALMERWFRAWGWEIGAGVGAVDNGWALVMPFIIFGWEEGRRWGGSTVLEADNTVKSDAAAECDDWRLQVEDDQMKLGRWAECAVEPNC